MKNKTALVLAFLLYVNVQAQKHDNIWLLGLGNVNNRRTISYLDFNFSPLKIDTLSVPQKFDLIVGNTMISDREGTLKCYSNGCSVVSGSHGYIENGDSLNLGDGFFYCANYGYFHLHQGIILLPYPEHQGQYLLVHLNTREREKYPNELLYTVVDMNQNDGAGKVTLKNELVYEKDFSDLLTAVKHGNGRDWWVVVPQRSSNTYFIFLVSPEGVSQPKIQSVGSNRMGDFVSPAVFSPDGTLYARANHAQRLVQVLYFDRCAGEFCCPRDLSFSVETLLGTNAASGAAFSPSSRFLYISITNELFQFDMWSSRTGPIKIAEYDGFKSPTFATNFYQQRLAPDGKIYMGCTNGTDAIHTIHAPDSLGFACQFEQHNIKLPKVYGATLPNFPFFRLQDLKGSTCDTLGIDTPAEQGITWNISRESIRAWPNPASDETTLSLPPDAKGPLLVYDVLGRLVEEVPFARGGMTMTLNVSTYPAGVYFLAVLDYKTLRHTTRLVVTKGR